jgi:hypothetical protein
MKHPFTDMDQMNACLFTTPERVRIDGGPLIGYEAAIVEVRNVGRVAVRLGPEHGSVIVELDAAWVRRSTQV